MAHWRFVVAEVVASLPLDNPAKKELCELLGKPDLATDDDDELADLKVGFQQIVEKDGLTAAPRWLCMQLGMVEIVKTTPTPEGDEVTATFPQWLLAAEATLP